jgi:hypothetical protein
MISNLEWPKAAIKSVGVGAAHVAVVLLLVFLFRRKDPAPFSLGCVLIELPTLLAFVLYTFSLRPHLRTRLSGLWASVVAVGIGACCAIISHAAAMYIIVSLYGSG